MEEKVVSIVSQGGDVAFVIVLVLGLAFWAVLKLKEFEKRMEKIEAKFEKTTAKIEERLDAGDSRFCEQDKTIVKMAGDVEFIRWLLEGKVKKGGDNV